MVSLPIRRILGVLAIATALVAFQPQSPALSNYTYYVDVASSATSNCLATSPGVCSGNCLTPTCGTQALPCKKIQDAINLANCTIAGNGDQEADIIVAQGTYPERLFIYPNVHVIGAGREVTTIDSQGVACGSAGARCSVVYFGEGSGFGFGRIRVKFSISGFRLIHGTGTSFLQGTSVRGGGGILVFGDLNQQGWPQITGCRIEDNTLAGQSGDPDWNGAGIYISQGSPVISGNIIQRNVTTPPDLTGQAESEGQGGGIYTPNADCHPIITHNIIRNNVALAQQGEGGGIRLIDSSAGTVVSNNIIVGNVAIDSDFAYPLGGGGISVSGYALAYNNLVTGNVARGTAGGVEIFELNGAITNNTIVGNVLTQHTVPKGNTFSTYGGGVYLGNFPLSTTATILRNNVVNRNDATALGAGGGLYTAYSAPATVQSNDFFSDIPNEIRGDRTDGTVLGSDGNISLSPVFANVPIFWDHTNATGTSTTAIVFDSTRYAVNDWVEYNDDGVARKITAINNTSKTLTFTPALSSGTTVSPRIVSNWGPSGLVGGPNVTEDFRLTASSPLRDAGTNTGAPTFDLDDLPRPTDGDLNGSVITDIGAYEFRFADRDGDGVPDASDCAPDVNSTWNPPDQVPAPLTISSAQVLSWLHVPQSNVYNVYVGSITTPFTYNPTCLIPENPGSSASVAGAPPALNSAFYYLVGAVNYCGSGPIHSVPIVNPPPNFPQLCAPQGAQTDADGITDLIDNCPTVTNSDQADPDHDTVGSLCDNCPAVYNPSQVDTNLNGLGDDCEDADLDGFPLVNDCNDNNPAIHPGAVEVCNGIDDNCANGVDEGFDTDGDGFTSCGGDCDDSNAAVHPGAVEVCNGIDDNCVNGIDEGFDADNDGFTSCGGDCNDANTSVHPGAVEVCNGIDDNCVNGIDEGGGALCLDADPCTQDLCGGTLGCQHPAASDGTPCSDGNACTQTDACQSGVCSGSNPVVCTAPDTCHDAGTCNTTSGLCENAPVKADGFPCNDGDLCTQTDTCQTGLCTGSNPVICTAQDTCHDAGTCAPSTGICSAGPPKPDGSGCDDGNACTVGDTCQSGSCSAGGLRDADADAHPDALCGGNDCNDLNGLVWSAPAEVTNLVLSVAVPADPSWDSQSISAGPETLYDLVSGSLGPGSGLNYPGASCLQGAGPASYTDNRPDPNLGTGYWYLARARNSCGVGTYGSVPRDSGIPACP